MTATHHYLEIKLGQVTGATLAEHVAAKRKEGLTWQQIADNLHDLTGVAVSRETLRQWFPDLRNEGGE